MTNFTRRRFLKAIAAVPALQALPAGLVYAADFTIEWSVKPRSSEWLNKAIVRKDGVISVYLNGELSADPFVDASTYTTEELLWLASRDIKDPLHEIERFDGLRISRDIARVITSRGRRHLVGVVEFDGPTNFVGS